MEYFLIGVGGSGMRCLEAFTHLCAIGMFDNMEINMLSIDTDTNNGNKGNSEQLIERYIGIKGGDTGKPTANTFFSAKINLYKYAPEYSKNKVRYSSISSLNIGSEEEKRKRRALSDLFFDDDVQQFDLSHGYRAQTHLGSYLMYHSLIEAARNVKDGEARQEDRNLVDFINKISASGKKRVFILGSIFGGTGASSIPIIPKAIQEIARICGVDIHTDAEFGCSLLTEYFSFKVPDPTQLSAEKVIADSRNFSLNSQAALKFYESDTTVKQTYRRMYQIGWHKLTDFSLGDPVGFTKTGGAEQLNPCHITELLCACAAYDFFNLPSAENDPSGNDRIFFRSANFQDNGFLFEFADFIGKERAQLFMNKIGSFLAFCHIIINSEKGGFGQNGAENLARQFNEYKIPDYLHLDLKETSALDNYAKAFAFDYENDRVIPGWLMQVRQTVEGAFLFANGALVNNKSELRDFDFGKIFTDKNHQFRYTAADIMKFDTNPYTRFRKVIQSTPEVKPSSEAQKVERLNERFLAHIYNTLTKLYNVIPSN